MQKRAFKQLCAAFLYTFIITQAFAEQSIQHDNVEENVVQEAQQQPGVDMSPLEDQLYKVDNTDFELFLTAIVDAATQTGKQALLSEALLSCFEYLDDEQKEKYLENIEKELPELLECAQLYKIGVQSLS